MCFKIPNTIMKTKMMNNPNLKVNTTSTTATIKNKKWNGFSFISFNVSFGIVSYLILLIIRKDKIKTMGTMNEEYGSENPSL